MFVHLRRLGAVALLTGGIALLQSSCARNDSSIFIRSCLATTDRTACTFMISTTSTEIYSGQIDAAYTGQYDCIAAVENQMVATGDPSTLKTETDGVELYEAEVQVLDPANGDAALKQFSVPIAGYIDPAMGGQPSIGGTDILLVDAATVTAERNKVAATGKVQTVVASVIAKDRTLGGQEVHSQVFLFPVQIFYGGTCYEPSGSACCGGMSTAMADCRLAIDEATNCQLLCGSACHSLECQIDPATGLSEIASAHCPAHTPPDDSCCHT
jgi:hypothetical protein